MDPPTIRVCPVAASEPRVVALLDALTSELATGGYTAEQTFGFTAEQLQDANVHFVAACVDGRLAGVGGLGVVLRGVLALAVPDGYGPAASWAMLVRRRLRVRGGRPAAARRALLAWRVS